MHTGLKPKYVIILSILTSLCLVGATAFLCACSASGVPTDKTSAQAAGSTSAIATPPKVSSKPSQSEPSETAQPTQSSEIVYKNTQYGFDFKLPKDWEGYSVVSDTWQGYAIGDASKILATGPKLLIRSPKWTSTVPTQDIPIMVFTIDQWNALQKEEFAVSAAPIGPSELGRNSKYVFALPARYNFSFLPGYKEVEDILSGKPLTPNENFK